MKVKIAHPVPPDFKTHLNYVTYISELSKGLETILNFKVSTKASFSKSDLSKKIRLVELIKESIDEEYNKAQKEKDFAKVCSMWIPVKSYYLIFNVILLICVLSNNNKTNLDYSHTKALNNFRALIKEKKVSFNKDNFNIVLSCKDAISFVSRAGDTLRYQVDDEKRVKSLLKKLCNYKFDDFCRTSGLKEFRDKASKIKKEDFLKSNEISLFEFFYWYRIKTNYRDLSFLDKEIHNGDIVKFYEGYYSLTIDFYHALKILVNSMAKQRIGEEILK